MVLAFTGHRNVSGIRLAAMLMTEIMTKADQGYDTFLCGAARGADIIFERQVLLAKAIEYPSIRLICVIPHEEQARGWTESWRERYFTLLEQADDMVLVSYHYTRSCYHERNRYMVDNADTLLAVYDGRSDGGTAYTVKYAANQDKEIIVFHPETLERSTSLPRGTLQ